MSWAWLCVSVLATCAACVGASAPHLQMHDALSSFRNGAGAGRLRGTAKPSDFEWKPVVVVMAHSRRQYLDKTLCALLHLPLISEFEVAVSLDNPPFGSEVRAAIVACTASAPPNVEVPEVQLWTHPAARSTGRSFESSALSKIARHFRLAMDKGFVELKYSHMVLLEEDLVASPDFLHLFKETAWLLHADHSLWCVSAWNDNGFTGAVSNEKRLFRTDYFPGLGWMLRRQLWVEELREKWPNGRACIVPEVPRTKHIGDQGANVNPTSAALFHRMAFAQRAPPAAPSPPGIASPKPASSSAAFGDLFYLMQETYEPLMAEVVRRATKASSVSFLNEKIKMEANVGDASFLVLYERPEWERLAKRVGLPAASPRAMYRGTTILRYKGASLVLADRRLSPYLSDRDTLTPDAAVSYLAAGRAQSCDDACKAQGKRCRGDHLQWANTCEVLAKAFPCEAGCGHQVGAEIPCYVPDASLLTYQQCLTTDAAPQSCSASHRSTQRLCPCS